MKTKEAIINGKKVDIVVELDQDFYEPIDIEENKEDNLEDTIDLSKTMEFVLRDINE